MQKEIQMGETITPTEVIEPQAPVEPIGEAASKEALERYKSDMFKYKASNDKLKKELEDIRNSQLKANKNWEQYGKEQETKASIAEERLQMVEQTYLQERKNSVLNSVAVRAGMIDLELLGVLDMPEVQVETTSSGKIIVHGAEAAIQSLKSRKPHLFQSKAPSINPQTPEVLPSQSGKTSIIDINKLEDAWKKNPTQANQDALRKAINDYKKNQ
jgi:hypothetical protein